MAARRMQTVDAERLQAFLQSVLPGAGGLRVDGLERILGGASRATWTFDASWDVGGGAERHGLILRAGESAYGGVLGSPGGVEYEVYRALGARTGLPVPRVRWLEPTGEWLGYPFFVMDRIEGCESSPTLLLGERRAIGKRVGEAFFRLGGDLTHFDWRPTDIPRVLDPVAPEDCWRRELDRWENAIEVSRYEAQPIVRLAVDWLRRHPPPPAARVTLLSGDYRIGNVLYDDEGRIRAWLDWEMAHLGDPLEDLAWALLPMWRWGTELACGVIAEDDAIAAWESASGLRADRSALHWWRVFQHVKAQGIWQAAVRAFSEGVTDELTQATIATRITAMEDRALLATLGWDR